MIYVEYVLSACIFLSCFTYLCLVRNDLIKMFKQTNKTNQSIHYMVFCSQKIPNKDLSWSKSELIYTRLYLNKLESIMHALSDALPTGQRAMANPTLQLHFDCGRATPPVSHSHNWPSGRMPKFLFKIGQKSYFLPIKTQKLTLTLE